MERMLWCSDSYSNPGQIVLEGGFSLEFPLSLSFWCAASSRGSLASLRFSSCVSLASYQVCTSTGFFGFASLEDVQQQKFHFLKKIEL